MDYKFYDELNTNTQIGWWNAGRKKLNIAIREFNQWQMDGRNLDEVSKLDARLEWAYQVLMDEDGGNAWCDTVMEMKNYVKAYVAECYAE